MSLSDALLGPPLLRVSSQPVFPSYYTDDDIDGWANGLANDHTPPSQWMQAMYESSADRVQGEGQLNFLNQFKQDPNFGRFVHEMFFKGGTQFTSFWLYYVVNLGPARANAILRLLFDETVDNPQFYASHGTDHAIRVMEIGLSLAQRYHSTVDIQKLGLVCLLHDVGYPAIAKSVSGGTPPKWIHAFAGMRLVERAEIFTGSDKEELLKAIGFHNYDAGAKTASSDKWPGISTSTYRSVPTPALAWTNTPTIFDSTRGGNGKRHIADHTPPAISLTPSDSLGNWSAKSQNARIRRNVGVNVRSRLLASKMVAESKSQEPLDLAAAVQMDIAKSDMLSAQRKEVWVDELEDRDGMSMTMGKGSPSMNINPSDGLVGIGSPVGSAKAARVQTQVNGKKSQMMLSPLFIDITHWPQFFSPSWNDILRYTVPASLEKEPYLFFVRVADNLDMSRNRLSPFQTKSRTMHILWVLWCLGTSSNLQHADLPDRGLAFAWLDVAIGYTDFVSNSLMNSEKPLVDNIFRDIVVTSIPNIAHNQFAHWYSLWIVENVELQVGMDGMLKIRVTFYDNDVYGMLAWYEHKALALYQVVRAAEALSTCFVADKPLSSLTTIHITNLPPTSEIEEWIQTNVHGIPLSQLNLPDDDVKLVESTRHAVLEAALPFPLYDPFNPYDDF